MPKQISLKESVKIEGINIFTKRKNHAIFHPAPDDEGIVFFVKGVRVQASLDTAYNYRLLGGSCLAVKNEQGRVKKIEHLLSALYGLGINNTIVELSDDVCPRTDYGVMTYIEALAPLRQQGTLHKKQFTVSANAGKPARSVTFPGKPDRLIVERTSGSFIRYEVEFPHRAVNNQQLRIDISEESYRRHIMHARPIFFLPLGSRFLIDRLHRFHGVNDHNALLIGKKEASSYANKHRVPDPLEFVRHKILDAMGALALTGKEYKNTEFIFHRTGHYFDLYALRELATRNIFEPFVSSRAEMSFIA